jgi:putative transposase
MPSQRRLPHIYPDNTWLFLTWHLHGSLPSSHFPPAGKVSDGEAFAWVDRYVDRACGGRGDAQTGPLHLRAEAIATLVIEAMFRGEKLGQYCLGRFVVMANHVHLLLLPSVAPSLLLKALKGVTAREANRMLNRTGEQFWQRESYDHWVRNDAEWSRIASYIERNPVKAGLVEKEEDYPWSSANARWNKSVHTSVNAARKSACATKPSARATELSPGDTKPSARATELSPGDTKPSACATEHSACATANARIPA